MKGGKRKERKMRKEERVGKKEQNGRM